MIKLNPFAMSGLLIAVIYMPLLAFVLVKGKTKIARLFSLHLLTTLIWGISCSIIGLTLDKNVALSFWRLTTVAVAFIPVFLLHVVYLLSKQRNKILLYVAYAQALFFACLGLTEELIPSTKLLFNSIHYKQGGTLYPTYFFLWLLMATIGHLKLIRYYKISHPDQKNQIAILIWGTPFAFAGGATNFLPALGINVYPYGNFVVPIYGMTLAYAILKNELLDIVVAVKKSLAYSVLITLVSTLYLLIVFILEKLIQKVFHYQSLTVSAGTAFGLGLIFVPLKNKIQRFVDQYFFKGTHEEIALQNAQLRQEIALSEKYKTLSTLASGIAHEIKNPLTAMKTFCEYLPRRLDDREFLLKFSRLVGKEVERIDGMVHELLDYSKPGPLTLKRTDINKLIEDTLSTLSNQFIKHHIEVAQHLSPDNYHLIIDANRVKQVLLNLFLNAIEAMPSGGKLTVSSFVDRTSHIVTIADTGSGIAPEDLKHIFDPFFSRKDHGTGLGLAIVQGIMEQHRGKVRITSQVGVGTEVKLEFPITT